MKTELLHHRRALMKAYRRYLAADIAWRHAQEDALAWFPSHARPQVPPIGQPGSPVRRLYDRRERALLRFVVIRRTLNELRRGTAANVRIFKLPPP